MYYPIDAFLKREQPDIFSAQEMLGGNDSLGSDFWTIETLIQKGHFDHAFSGYSRSSKVSQTTWQCTNFAKSPVSCEFEDRMMLYRNTEDHSELESHLANYSCLVHTKMRLADGAFVHILNHHGRLVVGARLGNPVADHNFKMIADYIATLDGPVILSGDFNLLKEATSLQPLKQIGLTNLNEVYGVTVGRNEFSWRPEECVSHVFVNDAVVVKEYRVPTDNVSDHLPLILKCQVRVG